MLKFPIDMALAAKARKHQKKGLLGKAMSVALGKGITTDEANLLASVGAHAEREEWNKLAEREVAILLALAEIQREDRLQGQTSSPKAKRIAWRLRLSEAQVRRATKRIDCCVCHSHLCDHLGLLSHSLNGHITLTKSGWAFVQAVEATRAATRGQIVAAIDKAARTADCGCKPCHGHPEQDATYEECAAIAAKVPA